MTLLALRFFAVLLPAVLLDLVLGDPRWLPHPVRWMGRMISALEPPLRRDLTDFGIPLFANIHLCGSVLTETFFVMAVSQILYGAFPPPGTMVLFCVLLAVFAIGAPGVPGGTVVASLGLITGVLGFDEAGTALVLTIFALQDSFGTACNITGDGALTLMLTGYAEKHGIAAERSAAGETDSPL